MTIKRGHQWGTPGALPAEGVVVPGDAAARHLVERARQVSVEPLPALGLLGGDLWRTLGAPAGGEGRLRSSEAFTFCVDLGVVLLDGVEHCFVSHLVARSPLWGQAVVAMNAQWFGRWNLGPRAHPNDGLLDVYEARLPLTDVVKVERRARLGAHLPHPRITERRAATFSMDLGRRVGVWLDGERIADARRLEGRIEPDALTVVV